MTTPAPVRQRRTWDLILTIVLLVLLVVVAAVAAVAGLGLAFVGDACGATYECNFDNIGTALMIGIGGPLVVGLVTLIAGVIVLILRRLSFWIPLVGIVLAVVVEVVAWSLATGSMVPMTS